MMQWLMTSFTPSLFLMIHMMILSFFYIKDDISMTPSHALLASNVSFSLSFEKDTTSIGSQPLKKNGLDHRWNWEELMFKLFLI